MSEITKLYENAGIKKIELDYPDNFEPFYPEFTAEKQIELIIFLINRKYPLLFSLEEGKGKISKFILGTGIAKILNNLWQDLTEEEKQQVKEILK